MDVITEKIVSRFSENFGPINDVLRLKAFQIVKVNPCFLQGFPNSFKTGSAIKVLIGYVIMPGL